MDEHSIFHVLGSRSAKEILEYLDEHERAFYNDLKEFTNSYTLNVRLHEFLIFEIIHYHRVTDDKKRGYSLTEKGKHLLTLMKEIEELVSEELVPEVVP